jgi:hypothetical protein
MAWTWMDKEEVVVRFQSESLGSDENMDMRGSPSDLMY